MNDNALLWRQVIALEASLPSPRLFDLLTQSQCIEVEQLKHLFRLTLILVLLEEPWF